jgi:UDP-N-acetylglucosamine diphosphorylase/glucosamine-1-phosphate N-acetyltransferase
MAETDFAFHPVHPNIPAILIQTTPMILFDDPARRTALLPLTFTRPVADLRVGIRTVAEKWADWLTTEPSFLTEPYLQVKFPAPSEPQALYVNGTALPTAELVAQVRALKAGEGLFSGNDLLACRSAAPLAYGFSPETFTRVEAETPPVLLGGLTDIFKLNGAQIAADFERLTAGRTSQPLTDRFTAVYNEPQIFIEEGADIKAASLNATGGPIYIGRGAKVMEGALVQGPFALGEGSIVHLGGKMRPNTTVGPFCKVGGEIGTSVIWGFSNKGHEGFMGNSVVGAWCNWGADTNNSNLKNDLTTVKLHHYGTDQLEDTGELFVGLMMGDFSKAGINTMFNTGTVCGVSVNVFGAGFPPKHLPSFSWGGADDLTVYRLEKALAVARKTVNRRGLDFTDADEAVFREIFRRTHEG